MSYVLLDVAMFTCKLPYLNPTSSFNKVDHIEESPEARELARGLEKNLFGGKRSCLIFHPERVVFTQTPNWK